MDKNRVLKKELSSNVEIDADLAEILGLLSFMVSSIGSTESYLTELAASLLHLTKSKQVIIWLALERGAELLFIVGGHAGKLNATKLIEFEPLNEESCLKGSWYSQTSTLIDASESAELLDLLDIKAASVPVMAAPLIWQKNRLGLAMIAGHADQKFDESDFVGFQHAVKGAGCFIHNSRLLENVKSLFHDLDYMIQEWIADVSQRLDTVQQSEGLLGKILSDLSHEFRTPIASLRLYSGLIQKRPEKQEKYLKTMQIELSRLEQILEGILVLSEYRIYSGNNQLRSVQIDDFFHRYQPIFESELIDYDLSISFLTDGSCAAMADENYLFQALSQLVANAAKYGNGSDITVETIKEQSSELGAPTILIKIIDQGAGISENDAPHIFSPFYRGDGVGQSTIFGAGLGLTYAREIINSFGGSLTLANTEDVGTTMEVRLPRVS